MKSNPLGVLQKCGALLQGHFQLSSGLHSDRYFQCARVFVDPKVGAKLVKLLVPQLPAATRVIGPALGGILVAYELARQLGVGNVFAERDKGVMTLRRGFELSTGDRVIIAEDVVTTGGSSGEVLQLLRARGVEVLGLACLVDRSSGTAGARLE
ncbi:MAG TPA: orotate phosphoribosyltransferase, partial [Candidatus Xenobia bacterium]